MATVPEAPARPPQAVELHSGDRMTREEFHRLYEQTPQDFKAELIGGVVYVAFPLRRKHGINHLPLGTLLTLYEGMTPGVEAGDNTTLLLGDDSEPQPDLYLRVLPEYGGQSETTENDYVAGPPELVAEVAHSSRAIDLHSKLDDYARYGVLEYLVFDLQESKLYWFDLQTRKQLSAENDGIIRIRVFPGLWIDVAALLQRKITELTETLKKGLNSGEHADFVKRLAEQKPGSHGS